MLLTRVITALIFAPLLFGVVLHGGQPLAITCVVLVLVMLWEFQSMLLQSAPWLLKLLAYAIGVYLAVLTVGWCSPQSAGIVVPALTLLGLMVILAHPEPLNAAVQWLGLACLGAFYAGGLLPYLSRVRNLEQGLGLSLIALLCTWAADTGAYFAGKGFGKHKLYPVVSPGKTVEGAVGGWLCAIGVAFLVRALFHMQISAVHVIVLGSIAGIFGVLGDLCESLLKRSVGVKDSSSLIPGHGGVLDRFDAVMFVAPLVYIYSVLVMGQTGMP